MLRLCRGRCWYRNGNRYRCSDSRRRFDAGEGRFEWGSEGVAAEQSVMRNIRQNLFFTFIYNLIGVPIAAGILYPFSGLLLNPIIAGAAISFSSVSVVANALRLRSAVK
jgi:hypothetical protein